MNLNAAVQSSLPPMRPLLTNSSLVGAFGCRPPLPPQPPIPCQDLRHRMTMTILFQRLMRRLTVVLMLQRPRLPSATFRPVPASSAANGIMASRRTLLVVSVYAFSPLQTSPQLN